MMTPMEFLDAVSATSAVVSSAEETNCKIEANAFVTSVMVSAIMSMAAHQALVS
jgi:hypothetical protein